MYMTLVYDKCVKDGNGYGVPDVRVPSLGAGRPPGPGLACQLHLTIDLPCGVMVQAPGVWDSAASGPTRSRPGPDNQAPGSGGGPAGPARHHCWILSKSAGPQSGDSESRSAHSGQPAGGQGPESGPRLRLTVTRDSHSDRQRRRDAVATP